MSSRRNVRDPVFVPLELKFSGNQLFYWHTCGNNPLPSDKHRAVVGEEFFYHDCNEVRAEDDQSGNDRQEPESACPGEPAFYPKERLDHPPVDEKDGKAGGGQTGENVAFDLFVTMEEHHAQQAEKKFLNDVDIKGMKHEERLVIAACPHVIRALNHGQYQDSQGKEPGLFVEMFIDPVPIDGTEYAEQVDRAEKEDRLQHQDIVHRPLRQGGTDQ